MSERQAKKARKIQTTEQAASKKKSKGDIITNSIITVAIIAVLGLGTWAVYNEYKGQSTATAGDIVEQTSQTVDEYAASVGMTTEDFIAEYGLDPEVVTGDMDIAMAQEQMTLGNYAKMMGQDTQAVIESFGIENNYDENTLMSQVSADIQQAIMEEAAAAEATEETEEVAEEAEVTEENTDTEASAE